jgi:SAM-dependent methyltransferase
MTSENLHDAGWEKWHGWHAQIYAPVVTWFTDTIAAAGPAAIVLDVACGTGLPALALAARLPAGRVVAIDVSPGMVAATRRLGATLPNLEVHEMELTRVSFPDAAFDAVTCKDGLIYCADPVAGARALGRVLRPGGRIAVTAWDEPARCPFFRTLFETLARFLPGPRPDPRGPGPFRLSRPDELAATLADAGFADVVVERREVVFAFDSLEMYWRVLRDMVVPLAHAERTLPPAELARLRAALGDALAPYVVDGAVRVPSVAQCAAARRP